MLSISSFPPLRLYMGLYVERAESSGSSLVKVGSMYKPSSQRILSLSLWRFLEEKIIICNGNSDLSTLQVKVEHLPSLGSYWKYNPTLLCNSMCFAPISDKVHCWLINCLWLDRMKSKTLMFYWLIICHHK